MRLLGTYRTTREELREPIPSIRILGPAKIFPAPRDSCVQGLRFIQAFIYSQFLEVGQDAEWDIGRPPVRSDLKRSRDPLLQILGWFLGLNEELCLAPDAEAVSGIRLEVMESRVNSWTTSFVAGLLPPEFETSQPRAEKKGSMNSRRTSASL